MMNPEIDATELTHHNMAEVRRMKRRGHLNLAGMQATIDWELMQRAVAMLSPQGDHGVHMPGGAEARIDAARHLAAHYRAAGKPVPDILQALL